MSPSELIIYKRKQKSKKKRKENTLSTKKPTKKTTKKKFFPFSWSRAGFLSFLLDPFLGRERVFFLFFFCAFLVESGFSCFLTFLFSFINSHLWLSFEICAVTHLVAGKAPCGSLQSMNKEESQYTKMASRSKSISVTNTFECLICIKQRCGSISFWRGSGSLDPHSKKWIRIRVQSGSTGVVRLWSAPQA